MRSRPYFTVVTFAHVVLVPVVVHDIFSPIFTPSVLTTIILSSAPLASMQYPLSSTFVQGKVWPPMGWLGLWGCASAQVETRHSEATVIPHVFPSVRRMYVLLIV
jgi:hypothetical protein